MNLQKGKLIKTHSLVIINTQTKEKKTIDFIDKKFLGKEYLVDVDSLRVTAGYNIDFSISFFTATVTVYENGQPSGEMVFDLLDIAKKYKINQG